MIEPTRKSIAVIRKELKDALLQKVEEARTAEDAPLQDVKNVLYGNRAKIGSVTPPVVWVIPDAHTPEFRGGHTVFHNFTFDLVALVKDTDPQEGTDKAEDLAARLYDVIMQDRSLGGLVNDITPQSIDPAYPAGQGTNFYWAAVRFSLRVPRYE